MTFAIAIFTGAIKVFQIQEHLEEFIKAKQEWLNFITVIGTEFQLPLNLRQNAIDLIIKHKDKYLDLMKRDLEVPDRIKNRVLRENNWCDIDGKNISRTILEIAGSETKKMERRNSDLGFMIRVEDKKLEKKSSWYPNFLISPSQKRKSIEPPPPPPLPNLPPDSP
jgi:hypothetical protein